MYDSFLKAVVESYLLCQYTGAYIEEQVLNFADTEYLRELLGDNGTIVDVGNCKDTSNSTWNTADDENQLAETLSFEVHPSGEATDRVIIEEKRSKSRMRVADL